MNAGKVKYNSICIPEEVSGAIDAGIDRARRRKSLRAVKRTAAGVAAAVCIMFAGANIMPIYSYAADIPVLGDIVRVLHVGSGGERTDGVQAGAETEGKTVVLTFSDSKTAPAYTVEHFLAPNRVVFKLHGVRGLDFESISESVLSSDAVLDVYRNMHMDDSTMSITIVMKAGYSCEVSEYSNPGALALNFSADTESAGETVYYLRSKSMPYGDELGYLCEDYAKEGASQVKTAAGEYFVSIGQYGSMEDAEAALEELNAKYGDKGLYVAFGNSGEIPEE